MMKIRNLLKKQYDEAKLEEEEKHKQRLTYQENSHWFPKDPHLPPALPSGVNFETECSVDPLPGAPPNMHRYGLMFNEVNQNIDQDDLTYDLNNHGFRCRPFDDIDNRKQQILVLGCSYTFGIGLRQEQLWHDHLRLAFSDDTTQIWNIGIPGYSNDAIVRLAWRFLEYIRPTMIFVQWTHFHRREYVRDDNSIWRILTNNPKFWNDGSDEYKAFYMMHNDCNDQYCFEKNLAFLSNIAKAYHVILNYETIDNFPNIDDARDGEHPGPESHRLFAVQIYKQYLDQVIYDDAEKQKFLEDFLNNLDIKYDNIK